MRYEAMVACALIAGLMRHAWGMGSENAKHMYERHEKDKQMVRFAWLEKRYKHIKIDATMTAIELKKSLDDQMAPEYARKPSLKTLENLNLEDQGFLGALSAPGESYHDFLAGRQTISSHNGD